MARRQQIREVIIRSRTEGADASRADLNNVREALEGVNKEIDIFVEKGRVLNTTLTNLATMSGRAATLGTSLTTVGTALKSINSATAGTAVQTAKLDGYITNLEILGSVLRDLSRDAERAEGALDGINASAGMRSLVEILEQIATNTAAIGRRAGRTAAYLTDVELALTRAAEEAEDFNREMLQATRTTSGLAASTEGLTNAQRRLGEGGRGAARSFSQLAFGANPLVSAYASIAVNIFAVTAAFRLLNEAASFDRLQTQLTNFSSEVSGLDVSNLATQLERASTGALSLKESLQFATKGVAFNFTTKQLEDLTKGARKASIALGRDFNDSMDRVLRGISKQEIELFDELGIVTRLTPAFKDYATEVGKTVDELTDYERQLALTIEVQSQLDERFSGIDAGATAFETLAVNTKNATDSLLVFLSQALTPVIEQLNNLSDTTVSLSELASVLETTSTQADIFIKAFEKGNLEEAVTSTGALTGRVEDLNKRLKESKDRASEITIGSTLFSKSLDLVGQTALVVFADLTGLSFLDRDGEIEKTISTITSGSQRVKNELELQAKIEREIIKLNKEKVKQIGHLVDKYSLLPGDVTPELGSSFSSFSDGLDESTKIVDVFITKNTEALGPLTALSKTFSSMENMDSALDPLKTAAILLQSKAFKGLEKSLELGDSIDNLGKLIDKTDELNHILATLGQTEALENVATGRKGEAEEEINNKITRRLDIQSRMNALGNVTSVKDKQKIKDEIEILKAKRDQLVVDNKLKDALLESSTNTTIALQNLALTVSFESEKVELKLYELQLQILLTSLAKKDTTELQAQLTIMESKLAVQKNIEASQLAANQRENDRENLITSKNTNGSAVADAASDRKLLENRKAGLDDIEDAVALDKEKLAIAREEAALKRSEASAPFKDTSSTMGSIGQLDGLDGITKTALGTGQLITDTFASAADAGKEGFSGFAEYLQGNMEAFNDFSIGLANAAGSIYGAISDAKIAGIDREIAAEKKRDGKSVESLAKIKKLEAKKIKEKAKADKAAIAISTATGVMQTFAQMGFPAGVPMAAALAAMGLYQISQVDKAANGSIGNLSGGGGSSLKIESGSRDNKVDVSSAASAGEYAFVKGQAGQGNAGSFSTPGRLGGGSAASGASIMVGERGPEEITPTMPVNVTPSGGSGKSGSSLVFSPTFNIEAIDSAGFEAVTKRYSEQLFNSLEGELNARSLTLNSLD